MFEVQRADRRAAFSPELELATLHPGGTRSSKFDATLLRAMYQMRRTDFSKSSEFKITIYYLFIYVNENLY
jgi:hypothetical protein